MGSEKSQHRKDIDLLELKQLSYENRLRKLGWLSLVNKILQGDLTATLQYLKEGFQERWARYFSSTCRNRTRGNNFRF